MRPGERCLVTGVSGYLGSWLARRLCDHGFVVRGTVRSLADRKTAPLRALLPAVELVEADLNSPEGWSASMTGVDWVFHVASPQATPNESHRTETAVRGTEFVIEAALMAPSVRKIVLTSSEAAIAYGHPRSKQRFTEDDWTDLSGPAGRNDYFRSKTLAEKAAWRIVGDPALNPRKTPMTVINPGLILGPSLVPWARFSLDYLRSIVEGSEPVVLDMVTHIVDVRDCAAMQIALMANPETDGARLFAFALAAPSIEINRSVARQFGGLGFRPKRRVTPNFLIGLASLVMPDAGAIYGKLGHANLYETKHSGVFDYRFADLDRIVRDSVESMLAHGWIKPRS